MLNILSVTLLDIWSAGCVLAELLLGQPIFPGESGVDQLVEIIKVLGTPSREQIRQMNPNYQEFKFPQIRAHPWNKVFRPRTPPDAIHLISKLLEYNPQARLTALEACAHPFFDELREPGNKLPNGRELPPLFNLTPHELSIQPTLNSKLIPPHFQQQQQQQSATATTDTGAAAGTATSGSNAPTTPNTATSSSTLTSSTNNPAAVTLANVAAASAAVNASHVLNSSNGASAANQPTTTSSSSNNNNSTSNNNNGPIEKNLNNGNSSSGAALTNLGVDSLSLNSNSNSNLAAPTTSSTNNNNNSSLENNQATI